MPLVANLIAPRDRALARARGRAILLELGREARRRFAADHGRLSILCRPRRSRGAHWSGRLYVAWFCGLAAFALVVLNVDLFLPAGRAVAVFQLSVGAILLVEGLGLVVERFPFRRLLGARLAARSQRGGSRLRRAGSPRLVGAALTVLGIVWVGTGVLDVLRGALALL